MFKFDVEKKKVLKNKNIRLELEHRNASFLAVLKVNIYLVSTVLFIYVLFILTLTVIFFTK